MHMATKWGCRLALGPTDKSERFHHKAAGNMAFLHDMSFIECVELRGTSAQIWAVLREHIDVDGIHLIEVSTCPLANITGAFRGT